METSNVPSRKPVTLKPCSIELLSTGYWHVRFNANQFVQWPCGQEATADNAFGWYPEKQAEAANEAVAELNRRTP